MLRNLADEFRIAAFDNSPVQKDMRTINGQMLKNLRVVRDDYAGIVFVVEFGDTRRDDFNGVHVKSAVGLVEERKLWIEREELKNLVAFFLAAADADIHIAACVFGSNLQFFHEREQFFMKLEDFDFLARD